MLHWGEGEEGGSEHSVGGHTAALEIQLLGYNGQLYTHHSTANRSPNGVVGISILAKVNLTVGFKNVTSVSILDW